MYISSVGAELFHADRRMDGRTNMTTITFAVRNFWNAPLTQPVTKNLTGLSLLVLPAYSHVFHYTTSRGFRTCGQRRDSHPIL